MPPDDGRRRDCNLLPAGFVGAALAVRGVLAMAHQKSPLAIDAMGCLPHIAHSIMATNIQTQPITAVAIEAR